MLDFSDTHETKVEEYRQRAVRLLEQLKCSKELADGAGDSEGLEARELDFARGPGPDRRSRWRRATAGLGYRLLRMGAGVAGFFMLLGLVAIVTLGLPVPQTAASLAARQQLVAALERTAAQAAQDGEGFNAMMLPVGYNCRGFLWLGPARAEAV